MPRSTTWYRNTATSTTCYPSWRSAVSGTSRCVTAPGSRWGCGTSSPTVASGAAAQAPRRPSRLGTPPHLATSAECWLTAGGPHHTVLSQAVGTEELTDFADMINTELLIIDADTDRRSFANEIRWNAAAHRLGMP
jgi:hypothetical protein